MVGPKVGAAPLLAWVCWLALAAPLAAQDDHRLVFRTVATEHFDIHYHEPLGRVARHTAAQAEAIHARLSQALGLDLEQRVQVVLLDNSDVANGLANAVPYNAIRLRVVAPDDLSALADYDDWPRLLFTHEHTHVLHLENASGLPRLMRAIFGRDDSVQHTLPGWFIEGLATLEESRHTSAGRGRGAMFAMFLRMDALEGRILPLDWLSHDGEPWPHGQVRYAYGQAFLSFIAERHGERALGRFVEEYGRRLVPYGLNRAMRRATGQGVVELYDDFRAQLAADAQAVRRRVLARGLREGEQRTFHGEQTRSPRFVTDDTLVYGVEDGRHVPTLRRLRLLGEHPAAAESERLLETTAAPSIATPRARGLPGSLLFSAPDYHLGTYFFSDLFQVPRDGGRRAQRLTHGLRAREPDLSPDGRWVVYARGGAGTSHLEMAALDDLAGSRRLLVRSRALEQVYTPRFSPDGARVAYSGWSRGGYRDIWIVSLEDGQRQRITYDRALDRGPTWSPDGQTLYFSSDRDGIDNIYAYSLESGALRQVTNVLGGAFQPDVSPDGATLAYLGYSARGFDVFTMPLEPARFLDPAPPRPRPAGSAPSEPAPLASEPYSPLVTLLPRAWSYAVEGAGEELAVQLSTAARDAVGIHAWTLSTRFGGRAIPFQIDAGYAYRRARLPVLLEGGLTRGDNNDLIIDERRTSYPALLLRGSLGTSLRIPYGLRSFVARPEYSVSHSEAREALVLSVDPNYAPPTVPALGRDARLSLTLAHESVRRQAYDVSASWGHRVSLRGGLRHPWLGSAGAGLGLSGRAEQFVRLPWREGVLALAYSAAYDLPVSLGGVRSRSISVFDAFTGNIPSPADIARLRGFAVRTGRQLSVASAELRALVVRINRGVSSLPVFARRIHAALFCDAGDASSRALTDPGAPSVGVGGELRLDGVTGYRDNFALRLGLAQGVTEGGETQWYAAFGTPF